MIQRKPKEGPTGFDIDAAAIAVVLADEAEDAAKEDLKKCKPRERR